MNKLNKSKVRAMFLVMFIVLLTSQVLASGFFQGIVAFLNGVQVTVNNVAGDGTIDNPYIISDNPCILQYESLPFYFAVTTSSNYVIEFDEKEKVIRFDATGNSNNATVILPDEALESIQNYQFGVKPSADINMNMVKPSFVINEISDYYFMHDAQGFLGITDYAAPPPLEPIVAKRDVPLYNSTVAASTTINGAKSNSYYFSKNTWSKDEVHVLFERMGFRKTTDEDYLGEDWDYMEYHSTNALNDIEIFIPSERTPSGDVNNEVSVANIKYLFSGNANSALQEDEVGMIEELLTRMFITIGDRVLLDGFKAFVGQDLSIDSLIFNRFEQTSIDFYNSQSSGITLVLTEIVNLWFDIFSNITYVAYIIILVYIGIMVMLSSATEREAKARGYITSWITGLLILLFVPRYGVPIIMQLNNALVAYIGGESTEEVKTYYNIYNQFKGESGEEDILGSDSTSVSIFELQQKQDSVSEEVERMKSRLRSDSKSAMIGSCWHGHILGAACSTNDKVCTIGMTSVERSIIVDTLGSYAYASVFKQLDAELAAGITDPEEMKDNAMNKVKMSWDRAYRRSSAYNKYKDKLFAALMNNMDEFYDDWAALRSEEEYQKLLEEAIETVRGDIMGTMRAYAGKYKRFIFVIIWYVLLFQLIALTFLYFKRVFIIAILIAVFPVIMLFYCIDRISDGKSQTLSMWFKELLSNIFVQSVHAIIYSILVEMGLEIYKDDPTNWMFFVAAILMLIPAEAMLKEIFNLNGSTVRAMSGMAGKAGALALAGVAMGKTLLSGGRDKSVMEKSNKRFDKLQKKQGRADNKAKIRQAKRAKKGITDENMGALSKAREGVYHAATNTRKAIAKAAPVADRIGQNVKNVASVAAGVGYGLVNGADAEAFTEGAAIAKGISGRTGHVSKDDWKVKDELKAAYNRKNDKK